MGVLFDAFEQRRGQALIRRNVIVFEHDPQAGAVDYVLGADGPSELSDFHGVSDFGLEVHVSESAGIIGDALVMCAEDFHEHTAGIVDQIAKALRNQHGVDIARGRKSQLLQIVIGKRLFQRNFDGHRRLVCIRNNFQGHG